MKIYTLLAAAALALSSCGESPEPAQKTAALPAGESLTLAYSEIADMKAVGAEIATRDQAEAMARIPGTLVSLSVRAGDTVKKGQRIGMIVDSRLGHETAAYGAQAAAAEAEAARARADLARVQDLYNNKVYAKARLDQAVAASRAADAQAAAARSQQGASAAAAGQGAVLAPADGRVLRADIPAGSAVVPGLSIATVTAGPPVVRLSLPESLAGSVRIGARVLIEGDDREARVVQVYPGVSGGRVRVDAAAPGLSAAFVGQRVTASIEVGRRQALVVPRRFVSTRYGIDQVDVVTADKRLSAVPVQTAPTSEAGSVEILSGVAPGDTLFVPGKPS
ncbi:efflux RND transporter periplasmic adaptor subunit [uncultured Sphingosinicella sp.]|uniref:efflux RND transporter periplasmic adaptor subunit n=1 Tax=uncultured Sphingosinicella sp. TaxID=478748 RepID=UPI0030D7E521|tara:strand:+ start:7814 stop:8821 length:1008 start_codon:yes stop_codon:yes gene_type:complete